MAENKLLEYAKFYSKLDAVKFEIRNTADLGYHLNEDQQLLSKLDEAAKAIDEYLKQKSNIFNK